MWETIGKVLTDDSAAIVLAFLFAAVITVAVLGAKGKLHVRTKSFSFGGSSREREIIRRQIEAARDFVYADAKLLKVRTNDYHGKYIVECVYDKVVEWIVLNHISPLPIYIQTKQDAIWHLVQSLNPPAEMKTPSFRTRSNDMVKEIIIRLIEIRKMYEDDDALKAYEGGAK